MIGIACIGLFVVRFTLVIDADYENFIVTAGHQRLLDSLSEISGVDTTNIILGDLKPGSVSVGGDVSTDD